MSFTKVSNEIMAVLLSGALNDSERRVMLLIIRKTFGYHKPYDQISLTQFQKELQLSRVTVIACIKRLVEVELVKVTLPVKPTILAKNGKAYHVDVNDYENKLVKLTKLVKPTLPELVKPTIHTKERLKKILLDKSNNMVSAIPYSDIREEDKEKKQRSEFVDRILKDFKTQKGHSPTDDKPRQVAWNLIQLMTTFRKKHQALFDARSKNVADLWMAYWDWIQKQESFERIEKLKTVKLKFTVFEGIFEQQYGQKGTKNGSNS